MDIANVTEKELLLFYSVTLLILDIFIFPAFKLRFIEIGRAERWNFHSKTVKGFYDGCSLGCRVLVKVDRWICSLVLSPGILMWQDRLDLIYLCWCFDCVRGERERERRVSSGDYKSDTNRRDQMQISLLIVDSPVTFLFSTVLTQSVCAGISIWKKDWGQKWIV